MTILEITALPQHAAIDIPDVLTKTSLAIAEAYECDPSHVWCTWQTIEAGHYVEGDFAPTHQPEFTHPPLARLTCFEGKSAEQIEKTLLAAAKTLGEGLGMPDNVFITYHEAKSGQVIAGNGIVRKS